MKKEKVSIQNTENKNFSKLLNPLVIKKKESNLEEILKEIEEEQSKENDPNKDENT